MDQSSIVRPHSAYRELLRHIIARPAAYLSIPSIVRLRSFLEGLKTGLIISSSPGRGFDDPLMGFDDWVSRKLEGEGSGARDWSTIILDHSDDDEQAFFKFCALFLEFNEDYRGFSKWANLCWRLRLKSSAGHQFDLLMRRYAEPHRAYHNRNHVLDCIREMEAASNSQEARRMLDWALDFQRTREDRETEEWFLLSYFSNASEAERREIMALGQLPEEELNRRLENQYAIEMALWFHDSIYDTRAKDNEEKSAELADRVLAEAGESEEFRKKVRHLIMMTKHNAIPQTEDEAIIVGADLAILGAPEDEFCKYEEAIRKEYEWVPEQAYRAARSTILKQFLDRPAIFTHPHFAATYEAQARKNLSASLARLAS